MYSCHPRSLEPHPPNYLILIGCAHSLARRLYVNPHGVFTLVLVPTGASHNGMKFIRKACKSRTMYSLV